MNEHDTISDADFDEGQLRPSNILEAIDKALTPGELAWNRKKAADQREAEAELLRRCPSLTHAQFAALCAYLNFDLGDEITAIATTTTAEWKIKNDLGNAHTHVMARARWYEHMAEIDAAGNDAEKMKGLRIQTREEILAEYQTKMKSAFEAAKAAHGRLNALVRPMRILLADQIEVLASQEKYDDDARAEKIGLKRGKSHIVLQLEKAVYDLRNGAIQLNPNSNAPVTIADFCAPK